jgi:hypothetical protein|tara:strand:+ start:572 stop:724 length:153 start_codon:yes stop_codon:yes gene_type:complete
MGNKPDKVFSREMNKLIDKNGSWPESYIYWSMLNAESLLAFMASSEGFYK